VLVTTGRRELAGRIVHYRTRCSCKYKLMSLEIFRNKTIHDYAMLSVSEDGVIK
jgi:hypothetical protein